MPDSPSPRRLRLKFAAFGAIGATMVLLPLGQVLRYQRAEIQALVAERATLDPLAQALTVQRGLLGHRDVAERVLRGRLQLEAERRLRKADVDESLWTLQATLSAGFWVKALGESQALTQDWKTLASRVAQRQLQVPESHASHQLLLEQSVQVMDLVSAAAPAGSYAQMTRLAATGALRTAEPAALEATLQAHMLDLTLRTAALEARQSALATMTAALATLLMGLGLWASWARRAVAPTHGNSGAAGTLTDSGDGVRRSRGRRNNDGAATESVSGQLLQRLRSDTESATAAPPPPQAPLR